MGTIRLKVKGRAEILAEPLAAGVFAVADFLVFVFLPDCESATVNTNARYIEAHLMARGCTERR